MVKRADSVESDSVETWQRKVGEGSGCLSALVHPRDANGSVQSQDEDVVAPEGAAGARDFLTGRQGEISLCTWIFAVPTWASGKWRQVSRRGERIERR